MPLQDTVGTGFTPDASPCLRLGPLAESQHANFSPDGKHVFILNHFDSKVSVLDAATMESLADIDLPFKTSGSWGHSGCFSTDGAYYYQLSETEDVMVKVDARTLKYVMAIKVGELPSVMTILR